jgi:hypothetical protein
MKNSLKIKTLDEVEELRWKMPWTHRILNDCFGEHASESYGHEIWRHFS